MSGLAALILATPLLGMQLQAPTLQQGAWFVPPASISSQLSLDVAATLPLPELLQVSEADDDAAYTAAVRERQELGQIHRAMGIVTWAAMTITTVLGLIQYSNLYGFGAGQEDNPCATGSAVFGQDQCFGTPYPHLVSAVVTTALYTSTLTMSLGLLLNDPNSVLSGAGAYSDRIRAHSVLALVHLAGMIAQVVIGVGLSNNWFGDRANDYSSMQTVAAVHQVVGWTTWAALGAAGALMLF
ncbi:MAG: hypothetical protein M3Y87_06745 [Myxococcota bacterium]|nr:hypothetical protein [Myxococcota bacterium]